MGPIWNSLLFMDRINSLVTTVSVIIAVSAAISTILYAVSSKKRYKKACILSTALTALISIICFFSNYHLSDLRNAKEKTVNIKLRNYSTAISKSTSANKILEKQVFEDSSKLKIALKPIVSVDAGLSDKIVYLPASGTIKYLKADRSANKVIIKPSIPGQLVSGGPSYELYTQGETVTLELSGYIWYKIY